MGSGSHRLAAERATTASQLTYECLAPHLILLVARTSSFAGFVLANDKCPGRGVRLADRVAIAEGSVPDPSPRASPRYQGQSPQLLKGRGACHGRAPFRRDRSAAISYLSSDRRFPCESHRCRRRRSLESGACAWVDRPTNEDQGTRVVLTVIEPHLLDAQMLTQCSITANCVFQIYASRPAGSPLQGDTLPIRIQLR
jgi:hypothetical protein